MKYKLMRALKRSHKTIPLLFLLLFFNVAGAQTDLKSLIELAERNHPTISLRQAEAEAARTSVSLERNALLPSLDAAYQANLSTYNNITGLSFPGTLMPISGPPTSENHYDLVPGTAASLVLKWSPITFGQRSASIESSRFLYEKHLAQLEDEVLKLKFRTAFMYLEITTTGELIKTYRKNIERNEFNLKQVASLVIAGIRPSIDSLKFKGELSKAKTELYKLENLLETQKQELQELLVSEKPGEIQINSFFFENLPDDPSAGADLAGNPLMKMAKYDLEAGMARLKQVNRSWSPNVEFWGTTFARGSGIGNDGTINYSEGWSFSRYNYGVGLQIVFPILNLSYVKLKSRQQEALVRSSESRIRQTEIALKKQENIALHDLATSVKIAHEVPTEYEAHESAYTALQARYNAGLVDYTELIQAQYDLLNSESSLKNAYVNSWKSLLKLSMIRGDLNIFLNQIQN